MKKKKIKNSRNMAPQNSAESIQLDGKSTPLGTLIRLIYVPKVLKIAKILTGTVGDSLGPKKFYLALLAVVILIE
jgi:hypothetical protein